MPSQPKEAPDRVLEHLDAVDDAAINILKGHLLIEEALGNIIEAACAHPDVLSEARLTFSQKLVLSRAVSSARPDWKLWKLAAAFNSLRNELAHSLEAPRRKEKTEALVALYRSKSAKEIKQSSFSKLPEKEQITLVAAYCIGGLDGIRQALMNESKESQGDRVG